MKILIDSDVFVSVFKNDDSNHNKALLIAKRISKDTKYISSFTIPESATVLSHKVSQVDAVKFLLRTRDDISKELFEEVPLTSDLVSLSDQIFITQKRKNISWPDCLNMAIMKIHRLDAIFSFDQIYTRNGIKVL